MAPAHLTVRAVLFDVYATLLRVSPPPPDADAQWDRLSRDFFGTPPSRSRLEFSVACSQTIARQHAAARARGIPRPEVQWPAIVAEALPDFGRLPPAHQEEFVFRQMQMGRTLSLQDGASEVLTFLRERGCPLGIASNSQAYTLRELCEHLAPVGLSLDLFDPELCFWSFAHGFSKPDPHVFQMLTARLGARGITPGETLMVGDRLDNDIEPARAFGWQTWQLTPVAAAGKSGQGTFCEMLAWLR